MGTIMITPVQIKKIHALKNAIGLDEDAYRDMLEDRFRVSSSKGLTGKQAAALIGDWEKKAVASGAWKVHPGRKKHEDLRTRADDFASPAQLRMVEAMWDQVARAPQAERGAALDKLVLRIVKRDKLRFVKKTDVPSLVAALETMGAERESR